MFTIKQSTKKLIFGFVTVLPLSYILGLANIWPFQFKEELTPSSILGPAVLFFIANTAYDYYASKKEENEIKK